ncbi:hypothetical protein BJY00DRAFT_21649 [Aspergillus carlsbadensis]|nr:hypothetical protein BJY00DRAFT_21649 [Aspergillus carlsbadensis]
MLDVIPAWSSRNPDIASRSPDWHICEACGMLRPTAPAYWAKKKRQFTYMRFDGSERTWDAAAVRFCSKTDMIAPACPECVAGSPLAGLRFWFRQNKLRDSGGGGGGGGGGFRELTWKDVARGL